MVVIRISSIETTKPASSFHNFEATDFILILPKRLAKKFSRPVTDLVSKPTRLLGRRRENLQNFFDWIALALVQPDSCERFTWPLQLTARSVDVRAHQSNSNTGTSVEFDFLVRCQAARKQIQWAPGQDRSSGSCKHPHRISCPRRVNQTI